MRDKIFDAFIGEYALQKTLRFSLIPQGKTMEHIKKKNFLVKDEMRAQQYQKAKKIIDAYHRDFIEEVLGNLEYQEEDLQQFQKTRKAVQKSSSNPEEKKKHQKSLEELQKKFRQQVSAVFKQSGKYKTLFKKELIQKDLIKWLQDPEHRHIQEIPPGEEPLKIIEEFSRWTTYFIGFHENRNNLYTSEPESTAISYRIVHENLPRFLDNREKFQTLQKEFPDPDLAPLKAILSPEISSPERLFDLSFFNQCLNQKGVERYNLVLGGRAEEQKKIPGLNEYLNLYSQEKQSLLSKKQEEKKGSSGDKEAGLAEEIEKLKREIRKLKSCKMQELYKQILGEKNSFSFLPEKFEDDRQVLEALRAFHEEVVLGKNGDSSLQSKSLEQRFQSLFSKEFEEADSQRLFLRNDQELTRLFKDILGDWSAKKPALEIPAKKRFPQQGKKITQTLKKKREDWVEKSAFFSVADIEEAVEEYGKSLENKENLPGKGQAGYIKSYFQSRLRGEERLISSEGAPSCWEEIREKTQKVSRLWENLPEPGQKNWLQKKEEKKGEIQSVKEFLESLMALYHFLKPLSLQTGKENHDAYEKDESFYRDFDLILEELRSLIPLYNQVRNYVTRKGFSKEKYKLNFENNTLAAGWDFNKERDNSSLLFEKEGNFYLGISAPKENKHFLKPETLPSSGECYQKIHYKLLPGANKMLPKVFFSKKDISYYAPDEEILRIRNGAGHTKDGTPQKGFEKQEFSLNDCRTMIDFFKASLKKHPDWSRSFDFSFSPTNRYTDMSGFYREVEEQGYKISFHPISRDYIMKLVDEGKLYLFQIYSKDFSQKTKGKPNLQTLYWRALFDERNLSDVVYKLNGEAELFYRKASLEYTDKIWEEGHHARELKERFPYPIIKDRRYAKDQFLFHVPITINFKNPGKKSLNDKVNQFLREQENPYVIGLDRGERHLAYYSVVDSTGKIVEQGSLNTMTREYGGEIRETDYREKLDRAEKERAGARKSWGTIEKIKDLKFGYLSRLVHELSRLILRYGAPVIMEDLNFGFKRGRFKVEKQVYQKLEKALIDKLNYLVFKDRKPEEPGGVLRGYQLTGPFESFKDLGKQSGVLFYVPSYYTSKVCPQSGFINLFPALKYQNSEKSREFFGKFDSIRYNLERCCVEFSFRYNHFTEKAKGLRQQWTVASYGTHRIQNFRQKNGSWESRERYPDQEILKLFGEYGLVFETGEELKDKIGEIKEPKFWKRLTESFRLILQMRNSWIGTEEDLIISPVLSANKRGEREVFSSGDGKKGFPSDADANGAYHIALKGQMVIQKLRENPEKPDLKITNEAWFRFLSRRVLED